MSTPPPPIPEPDEPQPRQEGTGPRSSPPPDTTAPDTPSRDATTETPTSEASTSAASGTEDHSEATTAPEHRTPETDPPTTPQPTTPRPASAPTEQLHPDASAPTHDTPHGTPRQGYPAPQGQPRQGSPPQGQPSTGQAPQGYPSGSYLRGGVEGSSPPSDTPPPGSYPSSAPTEAGYPPGYPQGGPAPGGYPRGGPTPGGYPPGQQLSGYPPGYPQGNYPPPGTQGYPAYPDGGPAMAPPDDPLVPGDFSSWFQKIIGVVQRSWRQLAIFQLVLAVLGAIYSAITVNVTAGMAAYSAELSSGQAPPSPAAIASVGAYSGVVLIGMLVLGVAYALIYPASLFVVFRDAVGQPTTLGEAVRFGGSRLLATLGWGILSTLMILVGFLLLIIPGIYLSIVISATLLGVIVVERGSIGRCFTLVNPRFWPTTGRLVVVWLIYLVYYGVTHAIASAFGGPLSVTAGIVQSILLIPIGIFGAGVLAVMYAELRFREHPGVTTHALHAEMTGSQ